MKITNSNPKMPKLKFSLGEKVLIFTKNGLKEAEIERISIDFYAYDAVPRVYYHIGYDFYTEEQICKKNEGLRRLQENAKQLQLNFLPQ